MSGNKVFGTSILSRPTSSASFQELLQHWCVWLRRGPDGADYYGVGYVKELRKWTFPFIMAGINTRVVRRSNALLGHSYGMPPPLQHI